MNIADYLSRNYPSPPCFALVADVYERERGQAVDGYRSVSNSVRAIASAFRVQLHKSPHGFAQVAEPQDYDVVLMGRSQRLGLHHCGVYWQGAVLHALESGAVYQTLDTLRAEYPIMEFWRK